LAIRVRSSATESAHPGTARAQGWGISKVEVRFDDGAWGPAQPSAPVNKTTWRMRRITRSLQTGNYKGLRPRHRRQRHSPAVGAPTGLINPDRQIPDDSTGWHSIDFSVV
jgi:hypothetical protein